MVHLPSLQSMQDYWTHHRDLLLREYADGYFVIIYRPTGHMHFDTLQEVYKKFPVLELVRGGESIFGTLPMLIDISEEFWKEKDSKPQKTSLNYWKEFEKASR